MIGTHVQGLNPGDPGLADFFAAVVCFDWLDPHGTKQFEALVRIAGAARVMLGSDYPFDMGSETAIEEVRGASIPESERRVILARPAPASSVSSEPHRD